MAGELKRITKLAVSQDKFTPRLRAWLAAHPEGVGVETEEEARLVLKLLLVNSQESRAGAFHPSGLTRCPREQVYGYHGESRAGHSYGSQLQNIFNDGTWRHIRWQLMLMKIGILHDVEVKVGIPELRLTGSMDGQGTDASGDEWFFELKGTSISLPKLETEGPTLDHLTQVNAYLMASGLEQAVITYEAKSYQDWIEIPVTKDAAIIDGIEEKLKELNYHVDTDTRPAPLPDCVIGVGKQYEECPYQEVCDADR